MSQLLIHRILFLDSLQLSAERLTVGSPLNVSVVTRRVGPKSARSVAIEFQDQEGSFVRRGEKAHCLGRR